MLNILSTMAKAKTYICLAITQGEAILQHISISRTVADPLTKAIARDTFQAHARSLGLCWI